MKDNNNDPEENPFSFKKFLNNPSAPSATVPTIEPQSTLTASLPPVETATPSKSTKSNKKQHSEANPFSFKHFLHASSNEPPVLNIPINGFIDEIVDKNPARRSSFNEPPPLLPPPPPPPPLLINSPPDNRQTVLPDFINESIHIDSSSILLNEEDIELDNPYLVLENIPIHKQPPAPPLSNRSYFDLEPKTEELKNEDEEDDDDVHLPGYYNLENALNENDTNEESTVDSVGTGQTESATNNKQEDDKLIEYYKKLADERQRIIDDQDLKMDLLQKQLNELKQKEAIENKTLEKMILKVEKNLELTTERAIDAEKCVDKLKTENKQLKSQIQNLELENFSLKNPSATNTSQAYAPQTLQNFSMQLNTIASTAEQSFKQLFTGVDTLRLLASTIESFDKIKDVTGDLNCGNK